MDIGIVGECKKMLLDVLKKDYLRYFPNRNCTIWSLICSYLDTLSENRTLAYVITLRLCSYLDRNNYKILLIPFRIRLRKLQLKFGVEISYKSHIGAGFKISHGFGIVVHPNAVIGDNCTILQNCTIGNNIMKSRDEVATLGYNVQLGAGTKIIGPVHIGNNVSTGANAVIVSDIPDDCVVGGVPARIIRMSVV